LISREEDGALVLDSVEISVSIDVKVSSSQLSS